MVLTCALWLGNLGSREENKLQVFTASGGLSWEALPVVFW